MSIYLGTQKVSPLIVVEPKVQLNAPTLVKGITTYTITNPTTNGSYPQGYKVFIDGVLYKKVARTFKAGETITIAFVDDMSGYVGKHTLAVTFYGENLIESEQSNEIEFVIYTITQALTNLTASNSAKYIYENDAYSNTLTPATDYYLPSKITLLMGDTDYVTSNYDDYKGVISISAVTGNLSVTATADTENKLRCPWLTLKDKSLNIRSVKNADYYYLYMNDGTEPVYTYETPPFTYKVEQVSETTTQQFALNDNNYYESKCQGVANGWSLCKIVFSGSGSVTLHCISQGESSADYGIIGNINQTLASSNTNDGSTGSTKVKKSFSGEPSTAVKDVVFDAVEDGDFIMCKFRKDSSVDTGYDSLQFQVELG